MQLVGRALPIKLHSQVEVARTPEEQEALNKKWEAEGGHPQKRMMAAIDAREDGTVLCFDCGGGQRPPPFGGGGWERAPSPGCPGEVVFWDSRANPHVLQITEIPLLLLLP